MKKLLFFLFLCVISLFSFGQPLDTTVVFTETFDGSGISMSINSTLPNNVQWQPQTAHPTMACRSLAQSLPTSYYFNSGTSSGGRGRARLATGAIPVPDQTQNPYIYLDFAHICKAATIVGDYMKLSIEFSDNGVDFYDNGEYFSFPSNITYYRDGVKTTVNSTFYNADAGFSQGSYSTWGGSTPTNAWWKNEKFELGTKIFNSPNRRTYYRIVFIYVNGSGFPVSTAGWFVDNVKVTHSNVEALKPILAWQAPHYSNETAGYNQNGRDNIGPYTINAKITDEDTVNLSSIVFSYTVNNGSVQYLPNNIASSLFNANGHTVNISWLLPEKCYGDTIRYRVDFEDSHGNPNFMARQFTPYSSASNVTDNDAGLKSFYDFPWNFITGQSQPVKPVLHNRSPNIQERVVIGWQVNAANQPDYLWNGNLCMDFTDTIADFGSFIPQRGWNEIKAFIKSRQDSADNGIIQNDTILYRGFACDSLLRGDYTMGTPTADFPTLRDLKNTLWYCQIADQVTIKILPGTYTGFVFDTVYQGMSEEHYVMFQSATGNADDVIIVDNEAASSTTSSALTLNEVSHFRFNNLTIQGKSVGTTSRGVNFTGRGSRDIHITNCKILVNNDFSRITETHVGIGRTVAVVNNAPTDTVYLLNNTITGGIYGIYYKGASNVGTRPLVRIEGNRITTSYRGIYLNYCKAPYIESNRLYSLDPESGNVTGAYTGILLERVDSVRSLSKNYISSSRTVNGIYLTYVNTPDSLVLSNNVLYTNLNATDAAAIALHLSNGVKVLNNTVVAYSSNILGKTAAIEIKSGNLSNISFLNNLFVNQSRSTANTNYAVYLNVMPSQFYSDYNCYYSDGYNIGYYSVPRANLNEWRTAVNGQDAHSISRLPDFDRIDSVDLLKLTDYNGLECYRNAAVLTDVTGLQRNTLTYMGAYSTIVPSVNLAVSHLVSPQNIICQEDSYLFQVALMNAGSEPIVFSSTNRARIIATFSGAINEVDTVYHATGTLNPMGEVAVTLGNYPLPANAPVNLQVHVSMPGDPRPDNDTLNTSFQIEMITLDNALGQNEFEETFSNHLTNPLWKIEQISGAGNWIVEQGTGVNPAIAPVYGTGRLFYNSKNFSITPAPPISKIYLPTLSLSGSVNPIMEIWYAHDPGGSTNSRTREGIVIRLSSDGSEPDTTLRARELTAASDTLLKRYKSGTPSTGAWEKYTFDLSDWVGQSCVRLSIEARGYAGNNINIDRILIRNVLSNDCMVNDFYYYSEAPTEQNLSTRLKAKISNVGAQDQTAVSATLTISGANNYTETISNISIASQQETFVYFQGIDLDSIGDNTISVSVNADQNFTNNIVSKKLVSYADRVSYADTSRSIIAIGSNTAGYNLVNRVDVEEEIIVKAVRFYPVSALDAVGKRILALAADAEGNIRSYSDTLTITPEMVDTWVEIPLHNYALSNVSDRFYAGIQLVDPGFYIGAQLESPLRDSVFYVLDGNGAYTPQIVGKAMIGAVIDHSIPKEMAILALLSPRTNCDLGHEAVTVQITNNGTQTIPPGAVFHCEINGVNHYLHTLQDSVPRGAVQIFTFDDRPNMTNNVVGYDTTFTFDIWVEGIAGDRIRFNDTLVTEVVSYGKSNLPQVVSPVYVNYYTNTELTAQYPLSIPPGDGELSWFANVGFEEWVMQHQGDTFTTPTIFFDTAFYVNVAPGTLDEITVGNAGNSGNMQPFMFNNGYARGRILYTREELGSQSGNISKIALQVHSPAPNNTDGIPIKIYIKNTNLTTFVANTNFVWENETEGALLIYDGNLVVSQTGWVEFPFPQIFEYTGNNILILTETNCDGSCGTSTPTFKIATAASKVQYCTSQTTLRFSNSNNRFVMKFQFSNLNCASEKVPIQIIVPDRPSYDVETIELLHPLSNPASNLDNCALEWENIQVVIRNQLNIEIPANKVMVYATFNGTMISHLVDEVFAPQETKVVTFTTPFNFVAPTASITFNYEISTDLLGETTVYRGNDTVTGSFVSYRTDWFPDVIDTLGEYSHPFTIKLNNHSNNPICFFYDAEDATTPLASRVSQYTTGNLFDTVTYWVEALNTLATAPRCTTKRVRYNINIIVPDHDLKTLSLNAPGNFECGLMNVNLDVSVQNTKDSIIPPGTFKVKADFTGTTNHSVEHTIQNPIQGQATVDEVFSNAVMLGSATLNNIYDYQIYVDPVNPSLTVYHNNDTISGQLKVPATPVAPQNMTLTGAYGTPLLIAPATNPLNYFYFYDQQSGGDLLGEGSTFTTPGLYAPQTYYYSGRITHPDFEENIVVGTSSTNTASPFNFTAASGISQGMILYTQTELGGYAGRIDTISLHISTSAFGEIPVKLYLLNSNLTSLTASGSHDFNALKSSAQLIFDAATDFAPQGIWFPVAIPGGFDYTGGNLLLLTEHDCDGASCESIGVRPTPTFKASSASQRVLSRTSATGSFSAANNRINTRFHLNHTCESPRGQITVNPTAVPACDLMVTAIESPVTPKNPYTTTEQLKVHIKNYGTTAASGFTVGALLNGQLLASETYSGTIPAQGTGIHIFSGAYDLSEVYFDTEFQAYVDYNCDNFADNDTLALMLRHPDPCVSHAYVATGAEISNFTFAGVSTGTGTPIFNYVLSSSENGSYTDYTTDPSVPLREVVQGQFYPFSITNSWTTPNGTTLSKYIYIDWDGDNQFSASERMFYTPTAIPAPTAAIPSRAVTTGEITIPEHATLGMTRLRVITAYGSNSGINAGHPCVPYEYGETEDYAIRILPPDENDLGINQILHPQGSVCADQDARIRVVVKNFGSITQYFSAANPLQLTATVTGAVSGVYTEMVTSGSLPIGGVMTIIIDHVNLNAAGNYDVLVNLSYAPDTYLTNNQATSQATVSSTSIVNFTGEKFLNDHFDATWTTDETNSNYKWSIFQARTGNYPNAGPNHDHTVGTPIYGQAEGFFAAVSAPSSASASAVATLTSGCINLHYVNNYPKRVNFWYHIFGANATANTNFYLQVGSGDHFITMDSLIDRTQTSTAADWRERAVDLLDFDEVGCIRFMATNHRLLIDPAIDDISISNGYPDVGVEEILYPVSFDQLPEECLQHLDSINMTVRIKNYGSIPVSNFRIQGGMEVGQDAQYISEWVTETINPGESIDYTFTGLLGTSRVYDHNAFVAETFLDFDADPSNNKKVQIACVKDSVTGVDEHEKTWGVYLGQNVPNPAQLSTAVPFFIPEGGMVKLVLHTASGQSLYTMEKSCAAGMHQWAVPTDRFADGIYFYTLYFNDVVITKKMMIHKQ